MQGTANQPASARGFTGPSRTSLPPASPLLGEAIRRLRIRARQEGRTRARRALTQAARLQAFLSDVEALEAGQ